TRRSRAALGDLRSLDRAHGRILASKSYRGSILSRDERVRASRSQLASRRVGRFALSRASHRAGNTTPEGPARTAPAMLACSKARGLLHAAKARAGAV